MNSLLRFGKATLGRLTTTSAFAVKRTVATDYAANDYGMVSIQGLTKLKIQMTRRTIFSAFMTLSCTGILAYFLERDRRTAKNDVAKLEKRMFDIEEAKRYAASPSIDYRTLSKRVLKEIRAMENAEKLQEVAKEMRKQRLAKVNELDALLEEAKKYQIDALAKTFMRGSDWKRYTEEMSAKSAEVKKRQLEAWTTLNANMNAELKNARQMDAETYQFYVDNLVAMQKAYKERYGVVC